VALVRWTNLICGWLIILVALGFLIFLPGAVTDYEREPEDVWIRLSWLALSGLISALCFLNARSARAGAVGGASWGLVWANGIFVAGAIILLIADDDPALLLLLIPFVLGPAVALAWGLHRPKI
jgi:O-antigen/teichoic acid export membrane protein